MEAEDSGGGSSALRWKCVATLNPESGRHKGEWEGRESKYDILLLSAKKVIEIIVFK